VDYKGLKLLWVAVAAFIGGICVNILKTAMEIVLEILLQLEINDWTEYILLSIEANTIFCIILFTSKTL
jgi:hypothetical protein